MPDQLHTCMQELRKREQLKLLSKSKRAQKLTQEYVYFFMPPDIKLEVCSCL